MRSIAGSQWQRAAFNGSCATPSRLHVHRSDLLARPGKTLQGLVTLMQPPCVYTASTARKWSTSACRHAPHGLLCWGCCYAAFDRQAVHARAAANHSDRAAASSSIATMTAPVPAGLPMPTTIPAHLHHCLSTCYVRCWAQRPRLMAPLRPRRLCLALPQVRLLRRRLQKRARKRQG